jgi:hypothetical protein
MSIINENPFSPSIHVSNDFSASLKTNVNSKNQVKNDEFIREVASKHLTAPEIPLSEQELRTESDATILRLRLLFETRYDQPGPWPKAFPTASLDCEGLAHYLMTGKVGKFEEAKAPIINKVNSETKHKPYTCYEIWTPHAPWVREELGFWGPVHFFTHLENGEYLSKNGCGPVRFFDSFEEMLKEEAFPFGFLTEDCTVTRDIEQACIGESIIDNSLTLTSECMLPQS